MEKSVTHNTEDITRGKPQPKTPTLYYHTSGNHAQVTKRISSQAILLSLQSNNIAHRLNKHNICPPQALKASYFLA